MNVVFLALDGVSQTHFWQFREQMPTLWSCSLRAHMFRRFYANATGMFLSFSNFAYGNTRQFDHWITLPEKATDDSRPDCVNLFQSFHDKGYAIMGTTLASPVPQYVKEGLFGAWPASCGEFLSFEDHAPYYEAIDRFLLQREQDRTPFVLYASDRSCLFGTNEEEKQEARELHSYCEKGFNLLDRTAGFVLNSLERHGVLDKTLVVAYGSFGMDPWQHGLSSGRISRIPPYASACWTPMFMLSPNGEALVDDRMVCVSDLGHIVLDRLFPGDKQPPPQDELEGRDVFAYQRSFAISQNLFALEDETLPDNQGIAKSYAVTDGDFRLIVTSDGGRPESGGLELFFDMRDPINTRNLLDFFHLDGGGFMQAFGDTDIVHPHFNASFTLPAVKEILVTYNRLRDVLVSAVQAKESRAIARVGESGKRYLFPLTSFTKKKIRP